MRALLALALGAGLLTGCGAQEDRVRGLVETITVAANQRDAAGVRTGVDDLLTELDAAVRAGDLSAQQAAAVRERAVAVRAGADAIDPQVLARREAERAAAVAAERARAEAQARAERAAAANEQGGKNKGDDEEEGD